MFDPNNPTNPLLDALSQLPDDQLHGLATGWAYVAEAIEADGNPRHAGALMVYQHLLWLLWNETQARSGLAERAADTNHLVLAVEALDKPSFYTFAADIAHVWVKTGADVLKPTRAVLESLRFMCATQAALDGRL